MEGHFHHAVAVAAVAVFSLLHAPPATADESTINLETGDDGVTVQKLRNRVDGGGGGRRGRGDSSGCNWRVENFSNSFLAGTSEYKILGGQPTREHEPYFVYCNDDFRGHIWRIPGATGSPPRMIAEELVDHIPVPFSEIGINPTEGIAGLESWFWAEGYDGRAITYSDSRLGIDVAVEATPASVRWDFGDGTPTVPGDLGRAYPARSSVSHVYERSSGGQAYSVRLTIEFAVRYQVDGGEWIVLPGITRSQSRPYSVIQLQAVRAR